MGFMQRVEVEAAPLEQLASLLPPGRARRLEAAATASRALLAGRVVWNVNATAHGGGVAEMLQTLLSYGLGAGVDTRWLTLDGDPEFFATTKRLHNALHGVEEDGTGFGADARAHYEDVLDANLADLEAVVRPGDVVLLHDPQTAGLAEGVRATGARVVWRCHIGRDDPNAATEEAWAFLRRYLEHVDAHVFSRREYVPDWVPGPRVRVIPPSIDPFSAKNCDLTDGEVARTLRRVGLVAGRGDADDGDRSLSFTRRDGTAGTVRRHADLLGGTAPPPPGAPLVVQVSRWDRLKDMAGVLAAFAEHVAPARDDVHLLLAGPEVTAVSDDPEGAEVLDACRATWSRLPAPVRDRCHLACLPMDDVDENAVIVNALQRHATVVVQKSLVEGFGLTVTEALWKARPVLASAVGGIRDQVVDGRDGMLLPDPRDLADTGRRLRLLLDDPGLRDRLGRGGRARVRVDYLGDRHLLQYAALFADLVRA